MNLSYIDENREVITLEDVKVVNYEDMIPRAEIYPNDDIDLSKVKQNTFSLGYIKELEKNQQ